MYNSNQSSTALQQEGSNITSGFSEIFGNSNGGKSQVTELLESNDFINSDPESALRCLPGSAVKRAWFALSHLLLDPKAKVLKTGCNEGFMSFAMSLLNPDLNIIAVEDCDEAIGKATEHFSHNNLNFMSGNITDKAFLDREFKTGELDAIVNSFVLSQIYSEHQFNPKIVSETLQNQFELLKDEGLIFIQDYVMPPPETFVMLELPDYPGGNDFKTMSDSDLLIWYSENARSWMEEGCRGFYLDELPPRLPRTRMFRLPYKWAYDFILRKDNREDWEANLSREYMFMTRRDFRKELRLLGARVVYAAAFWDERIQKMRNDGHFKLFNDDGKSISIAPTSYVLVAQKVGEKRSLRVQERKPSKKKTGRIRVQAMRNNIDGRVVDVVSRDMDMAEVIPYRVAPDGRLKIFLHEGVPRGIANAIPRRGENLDNRRWSGHMIETISMDKGELADLEDADLKTVRTFVQDRIGLMTASDGLLEEGPNFYPNPQYIDERIETKFVRVQSGSEILKPKTMPLDTEGFTVTGRIRELDAQNVLDAITVGFIPSGRMEVQILALFEQLGIKAQTWSNGGLKIETSDQIPSRMDLKDILAQMAMDDHRFQPAKTPVGEFRTVQSVFVDEGLVDGGFSGLASKDLDFVVPDEDTINTAVVLPLTRAMSGEVLAGFVTDYYPVPQRHKGSGFMMNCPSFSLPSDVTNAEQARKFVAEKFGVPTEHVTKLGESYFCHIGLTPQRIYPFVVTAPASAFGPNNGVTSLTPLRDLWRLIYLDNTESFMATISRAYRSFVQDSDLSVNYDFSKHFAPERANPFQTSLLPVPGNTSPANGNKNRKKSADTSGGGDDDSASSSSDSPSLKDQHSDKPAKDPVKKKPPAGPEPKPN